MAIDYTNLFTNRIKSIVTAYRTMKTWYTDLTTIAGDVDDKFVAAGSENLLGPIRSKIEMTRTNAASLVADMARSVDGILLDRTTILDEMPQVTSQSPSDVLAAMVADMNVETEHVKASVVTVGSITTAKINTNAGILYVTKTLDGITDPAIYARANREYAGLDSQLALADDTITVVCNQDSYTDGVSLGSESFIVSGKPYAPLYDWKSIGNGPGPSLRTAQASSSVDLSFDSFVSDLPNGFTAVVGTAGTHFEEETSIVVNAAGSSLKINGNCELSLPLTGLVDALGSYLVGFLVRSNGSVTGATLNIFLEGTGYTTEASTTNEIVMNATALNAQTSFDIESFPVVLPENPPTNLTLRIEVTGMSAGAIYLDFGFMAKLSYFGGVGMAVIAGRDPFIRGDRFTFDLTNNDAGEYQQFMRDIYGVQLPTDASPSLAY